MPPRTRRGTMLKLRAVAPVCARNLRRERDFSEELRDSDDFFITVPQLPDGGTLHRTEPFEYRKSRMGAQDDFSEREKRRRRLRTTSAICERAWASSV